MADLSPGYVVSLTDGRRATVRFAGATHFAAGDWVGIELDEPTGKNDGSVQGERYFDCEPGFGMFIRPSAVASIVEQPARVSKPAGKAPGAVPPGTRGRAQSGIVSGSTGLKKTSALSAANTKRHSASSASPSPVPKTAASRLSMKSPTKSPTKQLSGASTPMSSRSSLSGTPRPSAAPAKPRTSISTKSSMGPPPAPSAAGRTARPSLSGPTGRTNRSSLGAAPSSTGTSRRPALRPTAPNKPEEADGGGTPQSDDLDGASPGGDDMADDADSMSKPAKPAPSSSRPGASRPSGQPSTFQRQSQSAALRLKTLETLQSERDKFESIIHKLQNKYQPQQAEIGDLRKKLKESEARLEEMATLDREMAEETADAMRHECETLRLKVEEMQLEVEVLREENEELGQVMSPEEKSSQGWLQMEKTNERLREALIRLHQIKDVKSQYEATKEKLLVSDENVENLKQQLETALGAEEMIEELADKNLRYQEQINELNAAIEDLEDLKEINDELENSHHRESVYNEQTRKITQQDEVIDDLEYTLVHLEDMRASQQISEAEATDLTTRSRAMMDLNLKLQGSVSKAQTRTIDVELGQILKLYLPDYYESEKYSVLALLRFKRKLTDQASVSTALEDIYVAYDLVEKLSWISALCERFESYINTCSAENFSEIKATFFELEPVERTLNFWMEGLKKNEVNMRKWTTELSRSIALLSHLAETVLPTSLETFADELCMRSMLTQLYIDNCASSMARLKSLLQSKMSVPEGGEEETNYLLGKIDGFVSQTRGLKVAMGKIYRSLDELRSRSLALSHDVSGPFKATSEAAQELSAVSRHIGESIVALISDESRTEPLTLEEALTNMMAQLSSLYSQSSDSGTENNDAIAFMTNKLRALGGHLEELDSISSDLSITSEFERRPSPWIARAAELRSNKIVPPDTDEEIRHMKNEIHEAFTALGVKDKIIEEQHIKVELVESRMREAKEKAAMVKDLESKIESMQEKQARLEGLVEKQRKDLQSMETEREEMKSRLNQIKRASGATGVTTTDGMVIDTGVSLATMRENETLRSEVESLQAAVRFLREENRRSNMLDPFSIQRSADMHSWLDVPLTQSAAATNTKTHQTASESRDVFAHLLKLTRDSDPCDLKTTLSPDSTTPRTAWRPSKTKLRYQVLQQREDLARWTEWRDDMVSYEREQDRLAAAKRDRVSHDRVRRHAPKLSLFGGFPQGLGHGMMGRAWEILGMQQHPRKVADKPVDPAIVQSDASQTW
ncbi:hypothetical protein P168DRAFT_312721 [Aspergillus campestris IBT 28561]|uniref:CAP-Gly domain-containing protein n=1 Tax=Aspergillus campestris (strain IBT 28561) TaxID=1392248 RepID=A0A2I1CVG3_ASPC2|nr:uncharacterized protein P168DRAFT_312721 [Aspergillus campestris IBT 28561]PKY01605.1 hypothetical protein P168DRAFT_312721 [Aspergillus campestris IBT 28561]